MRSLRLLVLLPLCSCLAADEVTSAASAALGAGGSAAIPQPVFDVIVVGAGSGGIAAAVEASRLGARVLVLEEGQHVGGQLLTVTSMDGANLGGFYAEFIAELEREYAPKSLGTCYFSNLGKAYEASVGERVLRRMLSSARVTVRTGARVVSVQKSGNAVTGLTTADGTRYTSRQVIDATEYGDVLPLAGAAYRVGRSRYDPVTGEQPSLGQCVQDVTYTVTLKNYRDPALVPPGFQLVTGNGPPGGIVDYLAQYWRFAHIKADGGCNWSWADHNAYRGVPHLEGDAGYTAGLPCDPRNALIEKTMVNALNDWPWVAEAYGISGYPTAAIEDRAERQRADCKARLRTLQNVYQAQLPVVNGGLGQAAWAPADEQKFDYTAACPELEPWLGPVQSVFPERPYVREARRGIGVLTLTGKDIRRAGPQTMPGPRHSAERAFATSIAWASYPVDMHGCRDTAALEHDSLGEVQEDAQCPAEPDLCDQAHCVRGRCSDGTCMVHCPGGPFQVPFGSLVPRDLDGLLFAEKNISQSRMANGATRLQPSTMATGEAAGALAALSVGHDARNVPPVRVQLAMLALGQPTSLWSFTDVPTSHPRWADVQLVSTWPIMSGTGGLQFSPDAALTRGQAAVVLQATLRFAKAYPNVPTFADVPLASPLSPFVEGLHAAGLTSGCRTVGTTRYYCPGDPTSREQLAVLLASGLQLPAPACAAPPYSDVETSRPTCRFIAALAAAGGSVECGPGTFCPEQPVKRGDAAAFLARSLEYMSTSSSSVGGCYRTPPSYCGTL